MTRSAPQPAVERIVEPVAHALVVGVVPGQPELVVRTAARWALAVGGTLHLAYVDTGRYVVEEHPDGTVRHAPVDPDGVDDTWDTVEADLRAWVEELLGPTSAPTRIPTGIPTSSPTSAASAAVPWVLHYLAGRPDRALTHLARAVDAAAIVVGTRAPGPGSKLRELVDGSVAVHLAHHQHRPVLTVPLDVVDWTATRSPW
ncbi:universal stress protein UspA [Cellulomonas sp. A375-1]|uniref:universal stress protein n=1 Tax=Cellulomonas sp. A375-1 TaxID=1672219 RepID=UPI0006527489|nr:universal stress protein [Cellulomonas sp. A375-1]KMM44366.1 universal stress protein UspA [Cellulomonas sp. A375-1]